MVNRRNVSMLFMLLHRVRRGRVDPRQDTKSRLRGTFTRWLVISVKSIVLSSFSRQQATPKQPPNGALDTGDAHQSRQKEINQPTKARERQT